MEERVMFNHEKLEVYQASIEFIAWLDPILSRTKRKYNVLDHVDRASTSMALNIAEGNGKSSKKDQDRFLQYSRSSALECASCIDIMYVKRIIDQKEKYEGKEKLLKIVKMLFKFSSNLTNKKIEK
jgi:four helix bundle protein